MELRLFEKNGETYTRIKLSIKQEGAMIVEVACLLGEPTKTSKVYNYFESKGDLSETRKSLGLE